MSLTDPLSSAPIPSPEKLDLFVTDWADTSKGGEKQITKKIKIRERELTITLTGKDEGQFKEMEAKLKNINEEAFIKLADAYGIGKEIASFSWVPQESGGKIYTKKDSDAQTKEVEEDVARLLDEVEAKSMQAPAPAPAKVNKANAIRRIIKGLFQRHVTATQQIQSKYETADTKIAHSRSRSRPMSSATAPEPSTTRHPPPPVTVTLSSPLQRSVPSSTTSVPASSVTESVPPSRQPPESEQKYGVANVSTDQRNAQRAPSVDSGVPTQQTVAALKEALAKTEAARELVTSQLHEAMSQQHSFQEELKAKSDELSSTKQSLAEKDRTIASITTEAQKNTEILRKKTEAEDKLGATVEQIAEGTASQLRMLETVNHENTELQQQMRKITEEFSRLKSQLTEKDKEIASLRQAAEQQKKTNVTAASTEAVELGDDVAATLRRAAEAKARLATAVSTLSAAMPNKLEELQKQIESLRALNRTQEEEITKLKAAVQSADDRLRSINAENLEQLSKELERETTTSAPLSSQSTSQSKENAVAQEDDLEKEFAAAGVIPEAIQNYQRQLTEQQRKLESLTADLTAKEKMIIQLQSATKQAEDKEKTLETSIDAAISDIPELSDEVPTRITPASVNAETDATDAEAAAILEGVDKAILGGSEAEYRKAAQVIDAEEYAETLKDEQLRLAKAALKRTKELLVSKENAYLQEINDWQTVLDRVAIGKTQATKLVPQNPQAIQLYVDRLLKGLPLHQAIQVCQEIINELYLKNDLNFHVLSTANFESESDLKSLKAEIAESIATTTRHFAELVKLKEVIVKEMQK